MFSFYSSFFLKSRNKKNPLEQRIGLWLKLFVADFLVYTERDLQVKLSGLPLLFIIIIINMSLLQFLTQTFNYKLLNYYSFSVNFKLVFLTSKPLQSTAVQTLFSSRRCVLLFVPVKHQWKKVFWMKSDRRWSNSRFWWTKICTRVKF